MRFIEELKRRNVFRVGAAYVVFSLLLVLVIGVMAAERFWPGRPLDAPTTDSMSGLPNSVGTDSTAASPREKSIAVLPFVNQSAARENALFFSDGIHDDVLAQLSRIHELKVISRTSVMAYRDTTKNMREIGRELGVAHLLEGRVQQAGQRIRINVQLIDAATDAHLWAETYDTGISTDTIFQIQAEIARSIATALQATLTAGENDRLGHVPTENLDAYRAVLLSRQLERRHGFDSLRRSLRFAREAISLDAEYADAHVALALALITGINNGSLERRETEHEITAAIERAMSIDPDNATAWSALGYLQASVEGSGFSEAFEKALELDPGNAKTMMLYGYALQSTRRPEQALDILLRAVELDPFSSDTLLALGRTYAMLQQHERAREIYARIRESDPQSPLGYYPESASWIEQGRIDQALIWMSRAQAIDPGDFELAAWMLLAYDNLEHWASAAGWSLWLDGWITSQPLPLAMQARHYYLTGDFELALQYANLAINLGLESRWDSEITFMRIKRDEAIGNGKPGAGTELLLQRYPGLAADPPALSVQTLQQAVHLGLLLALDGRRERARKLLEAAITLYDQPYTAAGPQYLGLVPVKAEALAILGRNSEALAELERIVEAGWRINWNWALDLNASFNGLRETAKFKSLVRRLSNDIAAQRARVMELEADGTIAPPAPLPENGLIVH